jgi:hypothetical protein
MREELYLSISHTYWSLLKSEALALAAWMSVPYLQAQVAQYVYTHTHTHTHTQCTYTHIMSKNKHDFLLVTIR